MDDCELKAKVPEGEYVVAFIRYYTAIMYRERTPKLCLEFSIVEGDFAGIPLERFYSVDKLYDEPGEGGRFKPKGQTCTLLIEFCRCFPDQEIGRIDRLPMSRWETGKFIAVVRTVLKNHQVDEIPRQLKYSVIDSLKSPAE